jgi:dTDP-4-amino-4,6-dideoxygalactose transaminase
MLAPVLGGNEAAYLVECVDTGYVSSVGPFVVRFEEEFANFVGARYAVACASGTAALHLALLAIGVGPGSDVLVSDFTFIAPANAATYCGARVVLVDSEPLTWNLDPQMVVAELSRRAAHGLAQPAAVVVVHALGQPAQLEPILAVCADHSVPVIEDAAEALGARWLSGSLAGRQVGLGGAAGCFSFNGNKVLTTGGGGMIVTNDRDLADRARHLSTQARVPGSHYRHDNVGYNYRMTNVAAALGVAQMEQLPAFRKKKKDLSAVYDQAFSADPRITRPPRPSAHSASGWLYSILLPTAAERDAAQAGLDDAGIESRPVWDPVHTQHPYRDTELIGDRAVSVDIASRGLSLPSSPNLTPGQLQRVADRLMAALQPATH